MRFQKGTPYAHPKRGRVSLPKTCIGCWIRMEKHAELGLALDSHGTSLEVAVLPEVEERHGFWESVGREDLGLIRRRFARTHRVADSRTIAAYFFFFFPNSLALSPWYLMVPSG